MSAAASLIYLIPSSHAITACRTHPTPAVRLQLAKPVSLRTAHVAPAQAPAAYSVQPGQPCRGPAGAAAAAKVAQARVDILCQVGAMHAGDLLPTSRSCLKQRSSHHVHTHLHGRQPDPEALQELLQVLCCACGLILLRTQQQQQQQPSALPVTCTDAHPPAGCEQCPAANTSSLDCLPKASAPLQLWNVICLPHTCAVAPAAGPF